MLPGMVSLSGLIVGGGSDPVTDWFTTTGLGGSSETIIIPSRPGFTVARVTCIGPGGQGSQTAFPQTDVTYYNGAGGNGGNCATSVIKFTASDSFSALFNNANTYFQIGTNQPVAAATSGQGGTVGDSIFLGAIAGSYSNTSGGYNVAGAGAAGVYGPGNGTLAGSGVTWIRKADGAAAAAGDYNTDFGGGGNASGGIRGRGLVVVEWGIGKLY